jgi:hypothetical protein
MIAILILILYPIKSISIIIRKQRRRLLESSDDMGHLGFSKSGGHFLMEERCTCFWDGWQVTAKYECDVSPHSECRLVRKMKNYKFIQVLATDGDQYSIRYCRVCLKKNIRRETRFFCALCGVTLYLEGCYRW